MAPLGPIGLASFFASFGISGLAALYFGYSAVYHKTHCWQSRFIYLMATFSCWTLSIFHLVMATGGLPAEPYGPFDFTLLNTGMVFITKTPLLLLQIGVIGGMPWLEICAMIAADELMVLAGYFAQQGTSALSIWPLFFIGCIAQAVVFGQLYAYLPANDANNQSKNPLYNFLFIWIFIVWNLVTAVMVLDKLNFISYDLKALAYCVTEMFATVIYGLVAVGSHEAMEGSTGFAAGVGTFLAGKAVKPAAGATGGGGAIADKAAGAGPSTPRALVAAIASQAAANPEFARQLERMLPKIA